MVIKIILSEKDRELISDNLINTISQINAYDAGVMKDRSNNLILWCETSFIDRVKTKYNNLGIIDKMNLLSVKNIINKLIDEN